MDKVNREQFLALPEGTIYLSQNKQDIGFVIKGPTGENGSFQKRSIKPNGPVKLVESVHTDEEPTEFYVLDDTETMAYTSLIFIRLESMSPEEYMSQVLRLTETFLQMPNIRIRLPNGDIIAGDGKPLANVDGPSSVN